MYSSDLDELAAIADRVLVVSRGRVVTTGPDRESVGRLLLETAS
jgi:ABC-type sugar transport system ATPase subunit